MTNRIDRRILRTRQLLREVFLDLALENGIDNITVKELTDRAGLNRGTFYLHYQDIQDFVEQFKNEILEGFYSIIKKLGHDIDRQEPFAAPPPYGYVRPFEYVVEHKRFFQVFMRPNGDTSFGSRLTQLIREQFHGSYRYFKTENLSGIPVKQQYLFAYLASAYVGTIHFWIQRDLDLSPTELTILFSQISRLGSAHLNFNF
ncbi:TetR/AcrR family transcriptional regulator [Brevibacillus laterosporus]|uniref:TetR/AcrR family transcriptional regulator n=1 Tax=Brevibacillus laterosporus TaxID=1465 RepID=UPI000B9BB545|nr:TetR/AcrR family transcriptional regulator [Brevibacillus laterosporus]MBG9790741.1 TetR family transcriptional regulator [Brevibacillus laterosporus]MCG7319788.1 TetR/AcrR family transcriptional regulator [Brevibacillus laterosporus]MED1789728.1 TetR/AcrR family transcriptional regulator [Brevibacillus laterosporus]